MSIGDVKVELIDGAGVITTVLILTRLLLIEVVHVVECCKDCKRRVIGRHSQ